MKKLEHGYFSRHPKMEDLPEVVSLINATSASFGDSEVGANFDEMAKFWSSGEVDMDRDLWVVESPSGQIVGYEEFENRFQHCVLAGDGYVHPHHRGKGIGSTMLNALVERGKEEISLAPANAKVFIRNGFGAKEVNAMDMYMDLGFIVSRYHWRMQIDLRKLPELVPLPDGIRLEPFDVDQHDHLLWEAHHDAFKDHWGHVLRPYTYWLDHVRGFSEFDPALWLVAWDGDEIAGYSLNRRKTEIGWVSTLGVRRPWRRRGLGYSLLMRSFRALYQAGLTRVGLTVDSENPTGATRLYERAGMSVANQYIVVDKILHKGEDLTDVS